MPSGSGSGPATPSADRFDPGTLLADRYRIVRGLGRGAMGSVYQAEDLTLGVPVALKFLTEPDDEHPAHLELLLNEVRLARRITHPNVCRIYDLGEIDGLSFLSMEYVDGEDLASLLKRIGRLPETKAVSIGLELCRGLEAAHAAGILHRDLKPANLMIDAEGRARIMDFGIAVLGAAPQNPGLIAGTPVYMAPEQRLGQASEKSDLYALGLVLYELFTGRRAYPELDDDGRLAATALVAEGLDATVEKVIRHCLEPDLSNRPKSAAAVAEALGQLATLPWRPVPGQTVPGRRHWTLDHKLGEGGFGETWLAVHEKTRDRRVFKFCHDESKLRTLQREITLFRILRKNLGGRDDIAAILDWRLDEPPYYLESEYSAGGNLKEWAAAEGGLENVPLDERAEVAARVATALAAAHSVGVLHQDVKPANVLVHRAQDGTLAVRLCDFGVGAVIERERLEAAGITMLGLTQAGDDPSSSGLGTGGGTRLYMAPEILEGKPATPGADVYSLGVMLYQMAIGDLSRALALGWQREIGDELLREDIAVAVDGAPERRPSALNLADRLRALGERRAARDEEARLRNEAAAAREDLAKSRRRRRWVTAILAVLMLLAVTLGFAFDRAEKTARLALLEQNLRGNKTMARMVAAAVDDKLAAVERRVRREASEPALVDLAAGFETFPDGTLDDRLQAQIQSYLDALYEQYAERDFFSWVVADAGALAWARTPYDARVVGQTYAYREWWSGKVGKAPSVSATPRQAIGLTLAFKSTAQGAPNLMSVASPIVSPDGRVLGVLSATLHLETFNEWLSLAENRQADFVIQGSGTCPERFVLLLNRGQLLRHPCPDTPDLPVAADGFFERPPVRQLFDNPHRAALRFSDPLRSGDVASLAVTEPLGGHPGWTVLVLEDLEVALRPLDRLNRELRLPGRLAVAAGGLAFLILLGLLWRGARTKAPT